MNKLRDRIIGALALQPMTAAEITKCLSARRPYVRRLLSEMRVSHKVRIVGRKRVGECKRHWVWGKVA